jgi:hypothetical protein
MKLFTRCPYCKKETSFFAFVSDRAMLSKEKGNPFQLTCKSCNSDFACEIDKVYAKNSKIALIIGLAVLILGIPFSFILLNDIIKDTGYVVFSVGMIAVPFAIYQIINNQDRKRVESFNRFILNRHRIL